MMNAFRLFYLLLFFGITAGCKNQIIGLNESIRHDDFEYSVTGFEKADSIQSEKSWIYPAGRFVIVHYRVQNNALRVDHKWDNTIAYVMTEKGSIFENNTALQKTYNSLHPFNWQKEYITEHGDSQETILIFDVPRNAKNLYVMVRGYMLMGDVLNLNEFKRIRIKLY
ncbi:MAG TPA: hypothetical protein VK179_14910 [Bacteroidales bacterium]|nr:hypothetical protein [Bacteroidales bacterium]